MKTIQTHVKAYWNQGRCGEVTLGFVVLKFRALFRCWLWCCFLSGLEANIGPTWPHLGLPQGPWILQRPTWDGFHMISCGFIWISYDFIWFSYDFICFSCDFIWFSHDFIWFSCDFISATGPSVPSGVQSTLEDCCTVLNCLYLNTFEGPEEGCARVRQN